MPEPSWSATRARTFQECRRKYYFRYHLAPSGRRPDAPEAARSAWDVRDLTGADGWAGEVVHTVIEKLILNRWKAGYVVSEADVVDHARKLLSRQYRDSQEYWYSDREAYTYRPPLLDFHYYQEGGLSRERAAHLRDVVTESLVQFLRSPVALRIREVGPKSWLPVDRNASARLEDGLLVRVKPDFAYRCGDWLHILDWKTGRGDAFWDVVQVTCYALYAAEKWSQPLDRIVPQIVYLHPEFRIGAVEYGAESVHEVLTLIRESHFEIEAAAGGQELPEPERFPICEDCGRCRWCQFRGFCEGANRAAEKERSPTMAND